MTDTGKTPARKRPAKKVAPPATPSATTTSSTDSTDDDAFPMHNHTSTVVIGKVKRSMPGWAVALAVSIVSVLVAIFAVVTVIQDQAKHRADEVKTCKTQVQSGQLVLDIFGKLRIADHSVVVASEQVGPNTPFGHALAKAFKLKVQAYDELLGLAKKGQHVDCSKLR